MQSILSTMLQTIRLLAPIFGILQITLSATTANSGDFQHKPVELRINLALDRVSTYTDTTARAASAAYPVASSVNPASDDFLRDPPFDFKSVGALGSNIIAFNSGAWVTGISATGVYRLMETGTLSGTFVRTDSHHAHSRQGVDFSLGSNQLTIGFSQKIAQKYSYGISARLAEGGLRKDDQFSGFARNVDTDSLGGDFTLGILLPLNETMLLGVMGGAGWTASKVDAKVDFPPPPFGPGPFRIKQRITTRMGNFRVGIGWKPHQDLGIYVDGQYIHFDNISGTVDVGRAFLGGEYFLIPGLALRMGAAVDTEVQGTLSTGIGFYLIKNIPLEFAYSYNAFPEVRHEFGRAHLLSVSIAFTF